AHAEGHPDPEERQRPDRQQEREQLVSLAECGGSQGPDGVEVVEGGPDDAGVYEVLENHEAGAVKKVPAPADRRDPAKPESKEIGHARLWPLPAPFCAFPRSWSRPPAVPAHT